MTRTIKASEVKPGMNIRFDLEGWDVKGTVARMHRRPQGMWLYTDQSFELSLDLDAPVTVLSEPQPAEPTEFGAKVTVDGKSAIHAHPIDIEAWVLMDKDGETVPCSWRQLCTLGPVTVVPDQGWTVPTDAPEVPERIEEWPEDDTALRKHKWRDLDGRVWLYADDGWQPGNGWAIFGRPEFGPWVRVP